MKKITIIAIITLIATIAFGQENSVKVFGKILSENNKPIAHVKVILKGTKYETMTNGEGKYSFMLPATKGVLVYSHLGYVAKETQFTGTPQATDLYLVAKNKKTNK